LVSLNLKMKRTANVLGTGGHARVVVSILLDLQIHEKINIFELDQQRADEQILGISVAHFSVIQDNLCNHKSEDFFLAIGSNYLREKYWKILQKDKVSTPNLVASTALVDPSAQLGEGNIICHQAILGACVQIGDNNLLNTASLIEHESKISSHCHMAPKSVLAGRSTLGNNCFVGLGAKIIDKLSVANGTTIGAGGCLLESISEENRTYAGIPAKDLKLVK
jgi:UDP-N-acetylbacillosamine N-acetyltransferase